MRKVLMTLGWLGATAATTVVAYLAVDAAGSNVSDRPLATVVAPTTDGTEPGSTTLASGSTSTTLTAGTSSTTTTTSAPATSTTTTTSSNWKQQTINSSAGTVIVSYRFEEVRLESVAPLAGFSYEIDGAGPPEVRVEFDGPVRVEIRARWQDGQMVTEIDQDN